MQIFRSSPWVLMPALLLTSACSSDHARPPMNQGPVLGQIAPVIINQDTTATVPLSITDNRNPRPSLNISAMAADSNLVLPGAISVQVQGGNASLLITPAEAATGSTTIQVSVTDAQGGSSQQSFTLTVNAVQVSFASLAARALASTDADAPLTVNGITLVQDVDDPAAFDTLFDTQS